MDPDPDDLAFAPDGTLYVGLLDAPIILEVKPDGRLFVTAGVPSLTKGYDGDGGLARQTELTLNIPDGLALALDGPWSSRARATTGCAAWRRSCRAR